MPALAAIILAAGASSRMGRAKQLLAFNGQSLLRHTITAAEAAHCSPIIVVLGASADRIGQQIIGTTAHPVINPDWAKGIGSSIRCGVAALRREKPDAERLILMLCDQPRVTAQTIDRLDGAQQQSNAPVCAAAFADTLGPPVIVTGTFIPLLLTLPEDRGAKAIWTDHPEAVERFACPEAAWDVDTPAEYLSLME